MSGQGEKFHAESPAKYYNTAPEHQNNKVQLSNKVTLQRLYKVILQMLKLIRLILGGLIAFFNWLTRGRKLKRTAEQQALVEQSLKSMSLYQFALCPFCVKVRRTLHQLNLPMELRDAKNNQQFRQELNEQGGKIKVPCLRIEQGDKVEWMYESDDINQYLKERFAKG